MFEGRLREYQKRTDLWSIYMDQEIWLGDVGMIHALFERAISLSLPPKKMKFLFKKYLEFEKSLGDEERIESVKRKALEYVESAVAGYYAAIIPITGLLPIHALQIVWEQMMGDATI